MRTVKLEEMNTRSFAESGCDTATVPIEFPTRLDPFVKEIWSFDEVTGYGASGAAEKGTPEKGALIVDAVVRTMTDCMHRFEREGLVDHPVDALDYPDP